MKILAISGSARKESTNSATLNALSKVAQPDHSVTVFTGIDRLPIFSPDAENGTLHQSVQTFADLVRENDGLIIASPEYVRSIPGGLKNAIDWLVSRDEIIDKPIALLHASHRGDDMLAQLRLVLSTVSSQFRSEPFLRFDFLSLSSEEIIQAVTSQPNRTKVEMYLKQFADGPI